MKSIMIAGLVVLALTGVATAAEQRDGALEIAVFNGRPDQASVIDTAWIGRYGQVCVHGPVWLASCHASNRPGPYIPGHWNAMRSRWIPGRYS